MEKVKTSPRENEVEFEFGKSHYRTHKLDAISGMYLLKFLTQKLMPVIQPAMEMGDDNGFNLDINSLTTLIPVALADINQDDIRQITKMCLNATEKQMSEDMWVPCMKGDKYFVPSLEFDMDATLVICWKAIQLNCMGFFAGIVSRLTKGTSNGDQ